MENLIAALQIFSKYTDTKFPTNCEHDVLMITPDITKSTLSDEDADCVASLGFFFSEEYDCWVSYQFGSC